MSEEKPTFKITDRRLFNSDGTPRDIERQEEPETTTATTTPPATPDLAAADTTTAQTSSALASERGASNASGSASAASNASASVASSSSTASAPHDAPHASTASSRDEQEEEAGGDPTAFVNLIMFIASPAAAAMGMTEHPGMPPGDIDLPLAKHCIDLLATMRQKTDGNLTSQEEQIFEGLLAELRMQFVALSTPRPGKPGGGTRGFTGSDITGGR